MSDRNTLVPNPLLTDTIAAERKILRAWMIGGAVSCAVFLAIAVALAVANGAMSPPGLGLMLAVSCSLPALAGALTAWVSLSSMSRLPQPFVPAWRALIPLDVAGEIAESDLLAAVGLRREESLIVESLAGSQAAPTERERLVEISAEIERLLLRP